MIEQHGETVRGFLSDSDPVLQHKTYFVPPGRMEEPLQYVTLAQLEAYLVWRSDWVYEITLRNEHILPRRPVYALPLELKRALSQNPEAKINELVRCLCSYENPEAYNTK